MAHFRPRFVYFHITIQLNFEKFVHVVFGIRTWGRSMVAHTDPLSRRLQL